LNVRLEQGLALKGAEHKPGDDGGVLVADAFACVLGALSDTVNDQDRLVRAVLALPGLDWNLYCCVYSCWHFWHLL
jgi:hypothetical protein